jgi:hypothetical protein
MESVVKARYCEDIFWDAFTYLERGKGYYRGDGLQLIKAAISGGCRSCSRNMGCWEYLTGERVLEDPGIIVRF